MTDDKSNRPAVSVVAAGGALYGDIRSRRQRSSATRRLGGYGSVESPRLKAPYPVIRTVEQKVRRADIEAAAST